MNTDRYQSILVRAEKRVATVTLNKPDRKNPLGPAMINELCYAFDDAKNDPAVRVVVLTGAGTAFSAGGDLAQMGGSPDGPPPLPFLGEYVDLVLRITRLGKPVIARVPGIAMGGGLGLIAASHFAVAAESAVLGTPEIHRGLFPMMIMAVLARVVPRRELLDMMLLGEKMTATRAKEVGLVSHVTADLSLDKTVDELAEKLAGTSPSAMRLGLAAYHRFADRELERDLVELRASLGEILGTDDAREGIKAFLEKRKPVWT